MASTAGAMDTSADSNQAPPPFSFSKIFRTSFSDLLNGIGAEEAGYGGGTGVPKFKSTPPPSLSISPSSISPSNYFAIPPGLSPAELLGSPVLHAHSHVLPSPTTGAFSAQQLYKWKPRSINEDAHFMKNEDKDEESSFFSGFSFQTNPSTQPQQQQEGWNKIDRSSSDCSNQTRTLVQNQIPLRKNSESGDGYNWRKYGQKQVKASENPRSYYKCSNPNCPTKKIVEIAHDGRITEIVYKGVHNHPKPQSTRRNSSSSYSYSYSQNVQSSSLMRSQQQPSDMYYSGTTENSSLSIADNNDDDDDDLGDDGKGGGELYFEEPEAKRRNLESGDGGVVVTMNKTVREARVVVQTTSDIDILDDGYRWRKYGQKVVKGNPNPRSYYKCTSLGCLVKNKHPAKPLHNWYPLPMDSSDLTSLPEDDDRSDALPSAFSSVPSRPAAQSSIEKYAPLDWKNYFDKEDWICIPGTNDVFHVYIAGSEGPVVFCLHGGGYTGLSFAVSASKIKEKAQVVAMDLRGHGESSTDNNLDLSIETLCNDVLSVLKAMYGDSPPAIILVGHSMGGSVAVHVAAKKVVSSIAGLIVVDVVEGTAMSSLVHMKKILASRMQYFHTVEKAVEWNVKGGSLRNIESARVSIPSTLKYNDTKKCYTYRTPLEETEKYWKGWYLGLSEKFLSCTVQKQLLLAGTDRLDRSLTIGQMQGKFQMLVVRHTGHAIQEDVPDEFASHVLNFISRNRIGPHGVEIPALHRLWGQKP